jgi:hypothetical protein
MQLEGLYKLHHCKATLALEESKVCYQGVKQVSGAELHKKHLVSFLLEVPPVLQYSRGPMPYLWQTV